jgi:hypothetical protein
VFLSIENRYILYPSQYAATFMAAAIIELLSAIKGVSQPSFSAILVQN